VEKEVKYEVIPGKVEYRTVDGLTYGRLYFETPTGGYSHSEISKNKEVVRQVIEAYAQGLRDAQTHLQW
jgi:hypothetical protein